ncbi:chloramphenicol phosphotransferase CPT family protein [Phenylobacterium sp.]|uniref:chloramphenicol phosphotransferase CPT family protein n=1 Tax=Phenylobacterium sp. TaxID=1871053 RepID=UPI0037C7979F
MAPWPDLILLNGSSSSGKTSISKSLQALLPVGYLTFSVDDVFGWLPLRWDRSEEGFHFVPHPNGELEIVSGPEGLRTMQAWRRMVRAAVDAGMRAIVDAVFTDPGQRDDWADVLHGRDVFLVGVQCDLAELQRRELDRGDRGVGQALWQHERVHAQGPYDLELDTTSMSPDQCAEAILSALKARRHGSVLTSQPQ